MLNLAVLQFRPFLGQVEKNLSYVLGMIERVERGSVVALPEMWQCGFDYEKLKDHARATEKVLEALKQVSKEKELTLIGSYPLQTEGGIHNSAVVVDKGEVVGVRHKIKLFPLYQEQRYFLPGSENPIFELSGFRLGVLLCFELRFPLLSWELRGAELLVVPSLWGARRKEHLLTLSRARAIENQSFLMLANGWGKVGDEEYAGSSAIYSPWGEVLVFSERGDSLLQVKVDLGEVERVRSLVPIL